jgi:hypothetical protein
MTKAAVYRKQGKKAQQTESRLVEAVNGIKTGRFKNCAEAASKLHISSRVTVWRRLNGKTQSRSAGHLSQRILTLAQEEVLKKWIEWLGYTGLPLSKRTICLRVKLLCGRTPKENWIYGFLRRHPDCVLGRPAGLDPRRAQAFNPTTVDAHFKMLQTLIDKKQIPLSNVFNFDEIGIQLGGGRKGSGELYFFAIRDHNRYKLKSDDLELVTVLETICADGSAEVKPCFVFAGIRFCPEWFVDEDDIL